MSGTPTPISWDYRGARVLITGGSHGIGRALAERFAVAGADVTITGRRARAIDYDRDLSRFRYLTLDLEDVRSLDELPRSFGALDILVNNAGETFPGGGDPWDPNHFERAVTVNLCSVFRLSMACLPLLRASEWAGGASVIGIASTTSFVGYPLTPGYGAAKAGLVTLVKTLAAEWGRYGIRANAVAAGTIETNMGGGTPIREEATGWTRAFFARTPLRRVGTAEDVAGAVLFLCSAEAGYVTGETLLVDGGYLATTWEIADSDAMLAQLRTPNATR